MLIIPGLKFWNIVRKNSWSKSKTTMSWADMMETRNRFTQHPKTKCFIFLFFLFLPPLLCKKTADFHCSASLSSLVYVKQRIFYTSRFCALKSSLIRPPSTSNVFYIYTPSRRFRSSAVTRVFRISSFRTKSMVSTLSRTKFQLHGINPFLSVTHHLSVRSNLPWNFSLFQLQSQCPEVHVCVKVCSFFFFFSLFPLKKF